MNTQRRWRNHTAALRLHIIPNVLNLALFTDSEVHRGIPHTKPGSILPVAGREASVVKIYVFSWWLWCSWLVLQVFVSVNKLFAE